MVAAVVAMLIARDNAAPVAYIAGVWGTLVGADLLNLHRIRELGAHVLSIGGAGAFDGIFLVGIVAAIKFALSIDVENNQIPKNFLIQNF